MTRIVETDQGIFFIFDNRNLQVNFLDGSSMLFPKKVTMHLDQRKEGIFIAKKELDQQDLDVKNKNEIVDKFLC